MSAPRIVLASASPRRRALLTQIGLEVEVLAVDVDEAPREGEEASAYVLRLAQAKALAACSRVDEDAAVIAADTAVVIDRLILGKPIDREDFEAMLTRLSGRTHEVVTGVSVSYGGRMRSTVSRTNVRFRRIERGEIEAYWASGEPADKAGGYGIQGVGGIFVERLEGSYSGVMGLPLAETEQMLTELGVDIWKCRIRAGNGVDEGRATPWAKTSSSTSTTSKRG